VKKVQEVEPADAKAFKEGPSMDYSGCAFPKPVKKKKKGKWGR